MAHTTSAALELPSYDNAVITQRILLASDAADNEIRLRVSAQ